LLIADLLQIGDSDWGLQIADRDLRRPICNPIKQSTINNQSAICNQQSAIREGPLKFITSGSPRIVSRAIEDYASGEGHVTAIVVPWESDETTLSMAVTAVRRDGWAIEHTNLGTIRLIDTGRERTEVVIAAETPDHPEHQKLAAVFDRFARQIQSRLQPEPQEPQEQ